MLEFSPDKAAKFFAYARTLHDATNFEYAMVNWLNGIRQDPATVDGLKGFFDTAGAYLGGTNKKSPNRDMRKAITGRTPLDRYLESLLEWGCNPWDTYSGVRAAAAASELGLDKPAKWLAELALSVSQTKDKRVRKGDLLQLMQLLQKHESFDRAVDAGRAALKLDPSDSKLESDVRNLEARATMAKGGFDETGQVGGFRQNIRNAEMQRRLEEEDRVVKTEETMDRLVAAAKADYEARPLDKPAIRKYADRLLERGAAEDEATAFQVLMTAHEQTQEFAFRERAGKIRLSQARRSLRKLEAAAEKEAAAGAPGAAQQALEVGRKRFDQLELEELKLREEHYPSDLSLKFELARKYFEMEQYDQAIGLFQEAKAEVKNRIKAMNYLGQAFYKIEFHDGAIETFRQALEGHASSADSEMLMELRYGLMLALQGRAQENSDLGDAEEAYKLASQIAIQQFNYRDVRIKREELKTLIARLKGPAS